MGCKTEAVHIHLLERSQRVEVPAERAFDFYVDARNLEPMTPPWLHFEVTTPGALVLRQGARLDYKLRLHGVPPRQSAGDHRAIANAGADPGRLLG